MAFPPSIRELHRYYRVVSHSLEVRSHFDMLAWLQGDMQRYIPHQIMMAAWGDFKNGQINCDIISPLAGARSLRADPSTLDPFLLGLFRQWLHFGQSPFVLVAGQHSFFTNEWQHCGQSNDELGRMRCVMAHGIVDKRDKYDCLYVALSSQECFGESERSAMLASLPFIDIAMRQITHLPPNTNKGNVGANIAENTPATAALNLSEREMEVLKWVAQGKTNPEIAAILRLSAFTVKNHMQRVFQKLNVANRAQAVSKLMPHSVPNAQN